MKICCKPCCYHFSLIALDLTTLKQKDKQFGTNFAPIRRNRIQCHQKNEQLKLLWTNEFHGNLVYWYIDVCEKKEHSKFPFDIDNEHCFFFSKHTHTHTTQYSNFRASYDACDVKHFCFWFMRIIITVQDIFCENPKYNSYICK